jgi:hypothetical protein
LLAYGYCAEIQRMAATVTDYRAGSLHTLSLCRGSGLRMWYALRVIEGGFCLMMEAPPGMTGRFFVAVEPQEQKGGLSIWPKKER